MLLFASVPEPTQHASIRRFGSFEINLQSKELRKNGMRLRLSGQPFQILALLVEYAGEVVTREELHSKLWQADTFVDFDHGLNNAVARIREVLDDSSGTPRYVETIPRLGYRFIAPVGDAAPKIVSAPMPGSTISPAPQIPLPPAKGLKLWLAAAAVLLLGIVFLLFIPRADVQGTGRRAIRSLAVLPIENLSGDSTQEYLADGMTEEIIGRLAAIQGLRVISRTSVMRFKDTKLSVPEIAKMLKVDAVVEGSIMREANRIRVHAQLIRGAADQHFWSQTYDRQIENVIALQSDVAQKIAEKIQVTVTGQENARLVAARYVSPDVYDSYLKGRFGNHNTRAELETNLKYFENAIRKDPTFAPAYVGLANTYQSIGLILVGAPPAEIRPKEIQAAQQALQLDPNLAEAHVLLADVYTKRWQWTNAEAEYNRALSLEPNDAAAHLGFAGWLVCHGRLEEAVAWAQRARELDPLGPSGISLGWILFQARRYDESVRVLQSALAVHPDSAIAHFFLGFALIGKGQAQTAIPELEKTVSIMHRSPGSVELLATAYGYAGRRLDALRLITELKQRRQESYVPAGAFINPYLAIRNYKEVFFWFEQAYSEQSNILQFVKVHPFFDPLRGDPRFENLIHRVGLK